MELRIFNGGDGKIIRTYNELSVNLKYQSIADTFQFKVYFDPTNEIHRQLFKCGSYNICEIYHNNELLITGIILSNSFKSNESANWLNISGYSLTGIFEDCYLPPYNGYGVVQRVWKKGATLNQIITSICNVFNIGLVIDKNVESDCNLPYTEDKDYMNDGNPKTIKTFMLDLCAERNVILSHQPNGSLLLTRTNVPNSKKVTTEKSYTTDRKNLPIINGQVIKYTTNSIENFIPTPIFEFSGNGYPVTDMALQFNGQKMYSHIFCEGQFNKNEDDLVGVPIPQTNAINNDTDPTINKYVQFGKSVIQNTQYSKNYISDEMKGVSLGGNVSGQLVKFTNYRPCIVTPTSSDESETANNVARAKLGSDLQGMTCTIEIAGWTLFDITTKNDILVRPNMVVTIQNPEL